MKLEKERLLVISPHADDEILGCYGLIKKIKDGGGEVFVQILSLGGYKKIEGNMITKEDWLEELSNVSKILKVDMPITQNIYSVLFEGLSVKSAVGNLLSRVAGQE